MMENSKEQEKHTQHGQHHAEEKQKNGIIRKIKDIYDKKYKQLMILTFIILGLSVGFLFYNYAATGEFAPKDVSLKGGIVVTLHSDKAINANELQGHLSNALGTGDIAVRALSTGGSQIGLIIEAAESIDQGSLIKALESKAGQLEKEQYTVEFTGSSLGQSFFKQTLIALAIAFVFMAIVVFLTFRAVAPSLFIILGTVSDIVCTLAVFVLIGGKLSAATIAAFLMIIGYGVDTNILLTSRVLKGKEGSILDRTIDAAKTGLTMSLASLAAVIIALIFTNSDVIKQIMLIVAIGLIFDILFTWVQNAGILRWYIERKERKVHHGQA